MCPPFGPQEEKKARLKYIDQVRAPTGGPQPGRGRGAIVPFAHATEQAKQSYNRIAELANNGGGFDGKSSAFGSWALAARQGQALARSMVRTSTCASPSAKASRTHTDTQARRTDAF